ncbi:hypothetical protein AK812_SmicGene28145 [Symbiodinium microadriaticum]|uniref:Uncharacterized protein n=1 Tax=Symbiodinium microadriaticum TaxID=2951 RepID=A0A1Q9D5B5_SYMMI|nr:hypothetical protein AK812_SmicGene28145 [Symbiodinium microadriaticum]
MQRFHEADAHRHEMIVNTLMQKITKMAAEDHRSTIRIEELERQQDMLRAVVGHVLFKGWRKLKLVYDKLNSENGHNKNLKQHDAYLNKFSANFEYANLIENF